MAAAMDGWSRKEKLYILQGLSHLDFDKMETKIPTKTRQEIKNAVISMVNCLADAPRMERVTLSKLQHVIANAIEGKPVIADAAIMEILHVMIEEVIELCGGYISTELKEFISRINASAIPMPPSPAPKEYQRAVPGGIHAPAKNNIPSMYTPPNTNIPPMYTPPNTNIPPMYTPPNTNIPPMYTPVNTNIPPMYTSPNTKIPPMYTPPNTNIPMYTPPNTNIPPMYTPANTNIPPMYTSPNTKIPPMYTPPNTNIPPMYTSPNTKIPPIYTPPNTNIPSMYACNIQAAKCEFDPIHATATCQYKPIYAQAKCQYEPVYAPANYKYNSIYAPSKNIYNQYSRAMGNYNPIYAPPMYNLICKPGKANCVLAPCTICDRISVNTQGHFEPSTVPAHPPRRKLPSRPAGSGAYHAGPNGQYGHAMNRNE